jgi:acetyltransferase-like isoleucine patch superfamily enzyme
MDRPQDHTLVLAPREGVNDDVVRVLQWLTDDGAKVEAGQPLAVLETTKSTFDLLAPAAGYAFRMAEAGAEVAVGAPVALLSARPERPRLDAGEPAPPAGGDQVVTNKAQELIRQHGLALAQFAGLAVVRAADVEEVLRRQPRPESGQVARTFRGEPLDEAADWDALCDTELRRQLAGLLGSLRRRMKAKFNRHVPTGDLLYDRWDLARDYGFGEGTSVYDDCLVLGDVKVGRHCWVGPYTILDGSGGLTIGDYVDIGAGTHVYSHNTIERALTGHKAPMFKKATAIGNCCFIAPQSIIAPGTVIGDHCFVGAGSYVEGAFPAFSYIAGNPARKVGSVELRGDRASVRHASER